MRLFSNSDIRNFEPAYSFEKRAMLAEASTAPSQKDVFLSHSSSDDSSVPAVIAFFAKFGASVYADDFDKRLPNPPSPQTAQILRDEIKGCPRFVVLVTPNSRQSRWIPWELGLADGYKGVPPNALLPITPEGEVQNWVTAEYFGLYPRIVHDNGEWKVFDPRDMKTWKLSIWLKSATL